MSEASGAVVLFRVAAGPRVGFGHLVRALALAEALGVQPRVSIRGGQAAERTARRLGARVVAGAGARAVLASLSPRLLVLDDRVASQTAEWRRAARARGIALASVHDLGIGLGEADLVIDGSLRQPTLVHGPALLGPAYAILRPAFARRAARRTPPMHATRLLIALGGGPRATVAVRLARLITERHPAVHVGVAGGFLGASLPARPASVHAVPPREFDRALARADVVVTAGGVTLLEACSQGIPSVAVAVVSSQRPTIEDVASRRATLDGGLLSGRLSADACDPVLSQVGRLLADRPLRAAISRNASRLIDGRGAARVAAALHKLLAEQGGKGR